MNYQIIAAKDPSISAIQQVLLNRGIQLQDIYHYLNTTDNDILNPSSITNLVEGVKLLIKHINLGSKIFIQVDSDCDGYTSAAFLINYLNYLFPSFAQNNIIYRVHEGKQHGLILNSIPKDVKLIIAPDSSSNDYEVHQKLAEQGIDVLVIDHHEAEKVSEYACVINNQLCDYPTKSLSGVGMVYKFCSYIDSLLNTDYANQLVDLVALGIIADVMPMTDFETKHLINLGLENINNPYFKGMTIKNQFSLGENITPFGVAFYIAPYINGVTRCGTTEEKLILFESMLNFKAYEQIPSTKRGFKGTFETRVEQACRNCTNIKNRQNRARDTSMEIAETLIKEQNLLDNQILIICLNKQYSVDRNLTGLVATKIANDYQRPTLILNESLQKDGSILWEGSGRIFNQSSFDNFRSFLINSHLVEYAEGHESAFGCAIKQSKLAEFIQYSNQALKDFDFTPKYNIDLVYDAKILTSEEILEIANFENLWGKGIEEPYILIQNVQITKDKLALLKETTLKITLDEDISLIKFKSSKEEYDALYTDMGCVFINVIGHFQKNTWNGITKPQILIEDYEIINKRTYYF